jgi:hypothetical protein
VFFSAIASFRFNPLLIVQAVLMDLDAASTDAREAMAVEPNPATFQLCSNAWATLSVRTS